MARPTAKYIVTAEDRTKQGLASVERGLGNLKRQFVGLSAAVGAGLFVSYTKQAFAAADETNKLATQLGFTTEALSQYSFVAQQTGVDVNALTTGLQRMTRRVNEAAQGTGEAKNALFELGVDAQKLAQLRPEQQFEVLADAFSKVEDQGTKVRLAFKLFDTEGVKLLRTMEGGSEAIRQLRGEADSLGLTLDQDTADAATRANDALGRLKAQFAASGTDIVRIFGPAIEAAANWLGETLPKAVRTGEAYIVRARQGFASIGAGIADFFGADEVAANLRDLSNVYETEFDSIINTVGNFTVELGDAVNAADFYDDSLKKLAGDQSKTKAEQKALNKEIADAARITESVLTPVERYENALADLNKKLDAGRISQETFNRAASSAQTDLFGDLNIDAGPLETYRAELDKLDEALQAQAITQEQYKRGLEGIRETFLGGLNIDPTPIQVYQDELARLEEALNSAAISFEEYSRGRFAAEEAYEDAVNPVEEKIKETETALSEFSKRAAQNAQDSLADFLFDPFNSSLDDLVSQFADTMRRLAAEAAAAAIFDSFKGSQGGLGGIIGSFLSGYALGGPVAGRTPILVGERGPEVFVPNAGGGQILPNNQAAGSMINVNVTASNAVNRDSATQVGYDIGRQIQESMRRNG